MLNNKTFYESEIKRIEDVQKNANSIEICLFLEKAKEGFERKIAKITNLHFWEIQSKLDKLVQSLTGDLRSEEFFFSLQCIKYWANEKERWLTQHTAGDVNNGLI